MICRSSALAARSGGIQARVRLPHVLTTGGAVHREFPRDHLDASLSISALPVTGSQSLSSCAAVDVALPRGQYDAPLPTPTPSHLPTGTPRTKPVLELGETPVIRAIRDLVRAGETNAFNLYDLGDVSDQLARWRRELPRVEPFYAVKCNPNARIVSLLASLGASFDCASQAEIQLVQQHGVAPERIIFANPCKQPSHVAYAASRGIAMSVFDGVDELHKVATLQPGAKLLLRILVDDSHAVCTMSQKYGAPLNEIPELLSEAKSLGLDVAGVSFHVGSGARSAQPFADAVQAARTAFDIAASMGVQMNVLDIGGGFPGGPEGSGGGRASDEAPAFEEIAAVLRLAIDSHFPDQSGVRLIAEPGRFFVSSAVTLTTSIVGRKFRRPGSGLPDRPMYFVNDGLYGSFNCVLYDHAYPTPYPLFEPGALQTADDGVSTAAVEECSVWGPTCDGLDCVLKSTLLPRLSVGDWLCWDNMGAYTSAAGSTFNGMERPSDYYL